MDTHTGGHTLWTSTTSAWAPISPVSQREPGHWQLETEDGGVMRLLRMVVWVRQGERRPREGAQVGHSSEEKVDRDGLGGPAWEARLLGYRGLGRPLLVLDKVAQNPFSREKRRHGLKGYAAARSFWPLGWPGAGWGGVLRHKGPGLLGLSEVGWEGPKCNRNSQPVVTFPSVPSRLGLALGESTSKAKRLRWVKTSQAPPVSKANQSPGAQAEEGPGWEEPGQLDSTSTALPPGPSDPPLGWLLPSQRWVGA